MHNYSFMVQTRCRFYTHLCSYCTWCPFYSRSFYGLVSALYVALLFFFLTLESSFTFVFHLILFDPAGMSSCSHLAFLFLPFYCIFLTVNQSISIMAFNILFIQCQVIWLSMFFYIFPLPWFHNSFPVVLNLTFRGFDRNRKFSEGFSDRFLNLKQFLTNL